MNDKAQADDWLEPVIVQDGVLSPIIIRNPMEALEFLDGSWTAEKERSHKIAREICLAANKRQVSLDAARENFIRAVMQARFKICAPEDAADSTH